MHCGNADALLAAIVCFRFAFGRFCCWGIFLLSLECWSPHDAVCRYAGMQRGILHPTSHAACHPECACCCRVSLPSLPAACLTLHSSATSCCDGPSYTPAYQLYTYTEDMYSYIDVYVCV